MADQKVPERKRSRSAISRIMRNVHSQDTEPEVILKQALISKGYPCDLAPLTLPGKPDILYIQQKLAIFVDGDFWHGNQWQRRKLARLEDQFRHTQDSHYWLKKIYRTMERDCRHTQQLLTDGWTVLRFWESQIHKQADVCVEMIVNVLEHGAQPSAPARLAAKTVAEFFAGIGLMRLGLASQGWTVVFANDIDAQKAAMYQGHFKDDAGHLVRDDIHQLSPPAIPTVTLATASFPCNDVSLAGARNGLDGQNSSAFWGFIAALAGMGARIPPLVLLENVTGFLTSKQGKDLRAALLALQDLGYLVDTFVIDAVHFVPQSRQRLFIVGVQKNLLEPPETFPTSEVQTSALRPKALAHFMQNNRDIAWHVRSLPSLPEAAKRLEDMLEDIPDAAAEWWSLERASYLLSQMSPRHRARADAMINANTWSYGTVFRRMRQGKSMAELRVDGIAGCLRTPRGGSGRQILFKAGHGAYFARLITPREAARLMGADEYTLPGAAHQALFGFGDAVCVPVVAWIAQHYFNPLVVELLRGKPLRLML